MASRLELQSHPFLARCLGRVFIVVGTQRSCMPGDKQLMQTRSDDKREAPSEREGGLQSMWTCVDLSSYSQSAFLEQPCYHAGVIAVIAL